MATIERAPSYLPVQVKLAEVYTDAGNVQRAAEKYQHLIDLYRIRNQTRGAIGVLKRALCLGPVDEDKRELLISWMLQEGLIEQAMREMESIARAHFDQGEADLGLSLYERMVEMAPDLAWVRLEYGKALESLGRSADAWPHYVKSWELQPRSLESCWRVVRGRAQENDWAGAQAALEILLGLIEAGTGRDSGESIPVEDQGSRVEQIGAAVEGLRSALAASPVSVLSHLCLGAVLAHTGHLAEAEEHLQRVINWRAGPDGEGLGEGAYLGDMVLAARLHLGKAWLADGQKDRALALLSDGLPDVRAGFENGQIDSARMESYLRLMRGAYEQTRNRSGLLSALEGLKALHPDDVGLCRELAELRFELGDTQAAVAEILELAAEHRRRGDREAEFAVLRDCRNRVSDDPRIREMLCDVLLELDRCDDARMEMESLAGLRRSRGEVRDAAVSLRRLLELTPASDQLRVLALREQIIELDQDDSATREQLAYMYLCLGQASKALAYALAAARSSLDASDRGTARRSLQTVVRIDPWNAWALQELADMLYADEKEAGDSEHSLSLAAYRRLQKLSPGNEVAGQRIAEIEATARQQEAAD